jgi:starvation-inducible DNA-binding protein
MSPKNEFTRCKFVEINKMKTNKIGIEKKIATDLIDKLNLLLSNTQIFYMNTRGLHWNIKGDKFFELHIKFEELYTDLNLKVDEIAERILTLEGNPIHSFSSYIKIATIKELTNVDSATKSIEAIITSLSTLIKLEREILSIANKANDEGTSSLMSDYIRQQEKTIWMYSAFGNK